MTLLFFDTETTGLPIMYARNKYYSARDLVKYNSSRIVQLAWCICDEDDGRVLKKESFLISQTSPIPAESTKIHRITDEMCKEEGKPIREVFILFLEDVKESSKIIAHNLPFDFNIILSEMYRLPKNKNMIKTFVSAPNLCTLRLKKYGKKSLSSMYEEFFHKKFENQHNALSDCLATSECYFFMIKHKKK